MAREGASEVKLARAALERIQRELGSRRLDQEQNWKRNYQPDDCSKKSFSLEQTRLLLNVRYMDYVEHASDEWFFIRFSRQLRCK